MQPLSQGPPMAVVATFLASTYKLDKESESKRFGGRMRTKLSTLTERINTVIIEGGGIVRMKLRSHEIAGFRCLLHGLGYTNYIMSDETTADEVGNRLYTLMAIVPSKGCTDD